MDTIHDNTYYTASQWQLIWRRFKKNRSALIASAILGFIILLGAFSGFLSPYDPTAGGRNKAYLNGAPQIPQFCDINGCSLRPFIHKTERHRSIKTNFRWVTKKTDERIYVQFFVQGWEYKMLGMSFTTHLFGLEKEQKIHLFGTDSQGKDIFSRVLHSVWVSLAVGTLGMLISFVLALIIGGISGYFGGRVDMVLQSLTDLVKAIPNLPMFMALSVFIPNDWSSEQRFFMISCILGLMGWTTLARRVRTHILVERNADYVLAARLVGAGPSRILRRHLLPSFTSYIIVDLVISFPYMILSETSLSFIGLGLRDPVNSLGVMLQNVTNVDVMMNYWWYFIPIPFFIILVMSFVFVGDGLRDAADPYKN